MRNLLFLEHGINIPLTIGNYAYEDRFGRETVTWHRKFEFGKRERLFDATMIYSHKHKSIVDHLGTHEHVAVDLNCWVDEAGGINFSSGEQRCYENLFRVRFPRLLTGHAEVREWWDEDIDRYRIEVNVTNPILGHVIGYRGSFSDEIVLITDKNEIPAAAVPVREQGRE